MPEKDLTCLNPEELNGTIGVPDREGLAVRAPGNA